MPPTLQEISDVISQYSGLSRTVLEYSLLMKQKVDEGKLPGFSESSWAPLAAMVDTETFERVGNFKEVMTWPEYVAFLTRWACGSEWDGSFKRITESGDLVILELEERSTMGNFSSVVNSVSVYEFNPAGKIAHLDIYLQMPLPDPASLAAYSDVQITE
jgi:hypothetical protein